MLRMYVWVGITWNLKFKLILKVGLVGKNDQWAGDPNRCQKLLRSELRLSVLESMK